MALFFKLFGHFYSDVLLINNYLVLLLVFGPGLLVTIILVLNKIRNAWLYQDFKFYKEGI